MRGAKAKSWKMEGGRSMSDVRGQRAIKSISKSKSDLLLGGYGYEG